MKEILLILIIVLAFILYTQAKKMSAMRQSTPLNKQYGIVTHTCDQPTITEIFEPDNNADSVCNSASNQLPAVSTNVESSIKLPSDSQSNLQSNNINEIQRADKPNNDNSNKHNNAAKSNKSNKRTKNSKQRNVKFNPLVTRRFIDQDAPIDTTASSGLIEEITEPVKKS